MKNKSISKFDTENESFGKDYAIKAHHQQNFNEKIIESLSDSIAKWFPNSK